MKETGNVACSGPRELNAGCFLSRRIVRSRGTWAAVAVRQRGVRGKGRVVRPTPFGRWASILRLLESCWGAVRLNGADALPAVRDFQRSIGGMICWRRVLCEPSVCLRVDGGGQLFKPLLELCDAAGFLLLAFPRGWRDVTLPAGLRTASAWQIRPIFREFTLDLQVAAGVAGPGALWVLCCACTAVCHLGCIMRGGGGHLRRRLVLVLATGRRRDGSVCILVVGHATAHGRRWLCGRRASAQGRIQHAFGTGGHGALAAGWVGVVHVVASGVSRSVGSQSRRAQAPCRRRSRSGQLCGCCCLLLAAAARNRPAAVGGNTRVVDVRAGRVDGPRRYVWLGGDVMVFSSRGPRAAKGRCDA